MVKRGFLALIVSVIGAMTLFAGLAAATSTTTINPANAPTGTHLQSGTGPISCTVDPSTLLVTCNGFQLNGVGNSNATGSLATTYTATVDCTNHGGQLVPVKSTAQASPTSTGSLSPKNGHLVVPSLNSGPVPTAKQFLAQATCPNGNWTKSLQNGTIALQSFTYTVTFAGFSGPYITITGNDP
jgi:hypothetical protein